MPSAPTAIIDAVNHREFECSQSGDPVQSSPMLPRFLLKLCSLFRERGHFVVKRYLAART